MAHYRFRFLVQVQ